MDEAVLAEALGQTADDRPADGAAATTAGGRPTAFIPLDRDL
jgi:hypothetical protein